MTREGGVNAFVGGLVPSRLQLVLRFRRTDLEENRRGYLSHRQGRRMLRVTAGYPLGALAAVVGACGFIGVTASRGYIAPYAFGVAAVVAVGIATFLTRRWWPFVVDVAVGRVWTVEGKLRKHSTLGLARRIHYCTVANTSFKVSRRVFDAVEEVPCRCYYAPGTIRLLSLEPATADTDA